MLFRNGVLIYLCSSTEALSFVRRLLHLLWYGTLAFLVLNYFPNTIIYDVIIN